MSGPVQPPLTVETVDGATVGRPITKIKVTNGTLAVSGSTATLTISGGGGGSGTVTSVGLSETGSALTITGSPVTTSGTINIAGAGTSSQVILGDLTLGTLPSGTVTGTGTANQVSYWTSSSAQAGSTSLTYNPSTGDLTVGGYVEVGSKITTPTGTDLTLDTNDGTDSGSIVIEDGTDGQISINPNGLGKIKLDGVEIDNSNIATGYVLKATSATAAGWDTESGGGGGSGTVTSITAAADSGTGTAITTSGTLTFTGGTNITTSVSGTTVTIDSSAGGAIDGSGTVGTIPIFVTDTVTLGDSSLTQSGSEMTYTKSGGASFTIKSSDANEPNLKLLTSASSGLRFELTDADTITLKKVGTNTLRFRSSGTDFTIFDNTASTNGIFNAKYSTGEIRINNAYTLPTTVTGTNNYVLTAQTDGTTAWAAAGSGTVTGVTGTAPIVSSGGTAPAISITQSSGSTNGYLSSTDWTTFNNKQSALTLTTTGSSGAATLVGSTLNIPQYSGGGTIGGSIASTQVARGATTADEIEGDNGLLFDGTSFTINTLSASDPVLNMSSSTKSIALEVNTSQKLTVKGASNSFVLDASSATGGITFPDGTTQTTAATGGSVTFPLEGSDGTVSAPTYSFSNDTGMGMYKASGTSALRLALGGTDVLEIQKDGSATEFRVGSNAGEARISSRGSYDLLLQTDDGTNSGTIKINKGVDSTIDITPNGNGYILLDNLKWPTSDGTNGQVLTTDGSGGLTFQSASGGSSSDYGVFFGSDQSYFQTSYDQWQISNMVPFQVIGENATNIATNYSQTYKPFIAPKTGEITELIIRIATLNGSALNGFVSIYNSNSDGMPSTLIGYATFDLNSSTGEISQNTFSTAINLTKGTGYYVSWSDSQGSAVARTYRVQTHKPGADNATSHFSYCNQVDNLSGEYILNFSTSTTPDSPAGTSNYNSGAYGFPTINMVM